MSWYWYHDWWENLPEKPSHMCEERRRSAGDTVYDAIKKKSDELVGSLYDTLAKNFSPSVASRIPLSRVRSQLFRLHKQDEPTPGPTAAMATPPPPPPPPPPSPPRAATATETQGDVASASTSTCMVCKDVLEDVMILDPCGHGLCPECCKTILKMRRDRRKCPCCKTQIVKSIRYFAN